jgi:hypothetical protein
VGREVPRAGARIRRSAQSHSLRRELANESGKNGKPALVLAGSRRQKFAPVWTFGKDPYPLARSRRLAKIERPKLDGQPDRPSRAG